MGAEKLGSSGETAEKRQDLGVVDRPEYMKKYGRIALWMMAFGPFPGGVGSDAREELRIRKAEKKRQRDALADPER